jgi:hypothetical protein
MPLERVDGVWSIDARPKIRQDKIACVKLIAGTALARASPFGNNARPGSKPFSEHLDMKTMCGIVWHAQVR